MLRLREAERAEAEGQSVGQVCKRLGVSEQTLHRWRNQYGGMAQPEVKRLRELEHENERLKRLVADQALDISSSRRSPRETSEPDPETPSRADAVHALRRLGASGVPGDRAASIDTRRDPLRRPDVVAHATGAHRAGVRPRLIAIP